MKVLPIASSPIFFCIVDLQWLFNTSTDFNVLELVSFEQRISQHFVKRVFLAPRYWKE